MWSSLDPIVGSCTSLGSRPACLRTGNRRASAFICTSTGALYRTEMGSFFASSTAIVVGVRRVCIIIPLIYSIFFHVFWRSSPPLLARNLLCLPQLSVLSPPLSLFAPSLLRVVCLYSHPPFIGFSFSLVKSDPTLVCQERDATIHEFTSGKWEVEKSCQFSLDFSSSV